jgi:DNA-binding GntR family transcriptional regulator
MRENLAQNKTNETHEGEKAPFFVIKKVREAILEETLKPGDRLPEADLAQRFEVSRSPVREALQALEKEGTVIMAPYKGAIVKPLAAEEMLEITQLRLALITLAAKTAHPYLAPADFELAERIAKRIRHTRNAKDYFEDNGRFWDIIFQKAQRPILCEVFQQLDKRSTRYYPLLLQVFPDPASRPRQREVLIELYRKGKITEALRAFRKLYLDGTHQAIDYLRAREELE